MNLCFWFAIVRIVVCFRATFEMAAYVINKEFFMFFSLKCCSCSLIHRTFYYSFNSSKQQSVCVCADCQTIVKSSVLLQFHKLVSFVTSVYVYNMFYVYIVMGSCHMPVCLVTSTFTQS